MDLSPSHVLPFDQYITGITLPDRQGGVIHHEGVIEAYYMCGEMEKGNAILREHHDNLVDEFSYFNGMKPRHKSSIQREINEVMFQIEELRILLQNYDQQELMLELGVAGETLPGFQR